MIRFSGGTRLLASLKRRNRASRSSARHALGLSRNPRPSFETVLATEVQEQVNSSCACPFRPGNSAAHIARGGRHQMAALLDHPDRNVAPTKTSPHVKSAIYRTLDLSAT